MYTVLFIADLMISAAILIGLYRMMKGPSVIDRIIAFDLVAISVVAFAALLSIQWHSPYYLELILIISSLGFFGTVALVRYLLKTYTMGETDDLPVPASKEPTP